MLEASRTLLCAGGRLDWGFYGGVSRDGASVCCGGFRTVDICVVCDYIPGGNVHDKLASFELS